MADTLAPSLPPVTGGIQQAHNSPKDSFLSAHASRTEGRILRKICSHFPGIDETSTLLVKEGIQQASLILLRRHIEQHVFPTITRNFSSALNFDTPRRDKSSTDLAFS